jgi:hypothetical protein
MNTVLLMPELYLGIGVLALLVALGAAWSPLLFAAPVLLALAGALAVRSLASALRPRLPTTGLDPAGVAARRALAAFLHVAQPLVRLEGRLRHGLTPWRRFLKGPSAAPFGRRLTQWHEQWVDPLEWLRAVERTATQAGAVARRGGDFDGWDLELRAGALAGTRILSAVEEHGGGRQLVRLRCKPFASRTALLLTAALVGLAVAAALDGAVFAACVLAAAGLLLGLRLAAEVGAALALAATIVDGPSGSAENSP